MSDPVVTIPFVLTGGFGGFVFTPEGKRRLRLRMGDYECLFKVPRLLRRSLIGKLRPGEPIRVAGVEDRDPETGEWRRVATRIAAEGNVAVPVATCPVRVCAKKNCWRQGGRELWDALTRERANLGSGEAAAVELRRVGCLDRCSGAPNVDCGRLELTRCSPADAPVILQRALAVSSESVP